MPYARATAGGSAGAARNGASVRASRCGMQTKLRREAGSHLQLLGEAAHRGVGGQYKLQEQGDSSIMQLIKEERSLRVC